MSAYFNNRASTERTLNTIGTLIVLPAGYNTTNGKCLCRVLYQLCRGTITASEYDVQTAPWFNDIDTMWSFAYNTWSRDQRTLAERRQDPKVLDVSWTEYIPPSGSASLVAIKSNHFVVKENRMLQNPEAGVSEIPCE